MEQIYSMQSDLETDEAPQNIQFEIVEEELLGITRATVQAYEQG